jgi:methylmalonyl-CoA mutase cobalamin-binding subunit
VGEYLLWDIMTQLQCPTGHAVHPLPVTEALRVPAAAEITDAQIFGRRIEDTARRLKPHMDFSDAYAFAAKIVAAGKTIYNNALAGLKEADVDIEDPVKLLYILKKLGPARFEEIFGAGQLDPAHARGRKPVFPTDVFERSHAYVEQYRDIFSQSKSKEMLRGRRILIASTDVHEHAIMVIHQLLAEAGAEMINLGAETNPDQVAVAARDKNAEAILISTHNGMALDYARCLKDEMVQQGIKIPVVMGGILNQKVEDQALPIDVSANIKALDFLPCPTLENKLTHLLEYQFKDKEL